MLHIRHYDLNVQIRPTPGRAPALPWEVTSGSASSLAGGALAVQAWLTLVAGDVPVSSIQLGLYRLLEVRSAQDASGRSLAVRQVVRRTTAWPQWQLNRIHINLPEPIQPGGEYRLYLTYSGPVCGYAEVWPEVQDHLDPHYTLLRREVLWYPVLAWAEDKDWSLVEPFTFDLVVTTPEDQVAVTAGQPQELGAEPGLLPASGLEDTTGPTSSWQWRNFQPTERLDLAVAAFERLPAEPFVLYYRPEHRAGANRLALALIRALALLQDWLGPVQHVPSLAIVETLPGCGFQLSPGLALYPAEAFTSDRQEAGEQAIGLAIGQVAQAWGIPSAERQPSGFLNASLAVYLQALVLEEEFGRVAFERVLAGCERRFYDGGMLVRTIALADAGANRAARPALVYGKGPWLYAGLHQMLGDEAFWSLLRRLRTGSPLDLPGFVAECRRGEVTSPAAGQDVSAWFDTWLFRPGGQLPTVLARS